MKKLGKLSLAAVLSLSALAGCASGEDSGDENSNCPITVGFVTDVGGIDDHSFNEGSYNGIKAWAEANNLPKECYTYLQSKNDTEYTPNLTQLAEDGYDLVVAAGYKFNDAMNGVSKSFPDTKFLVIDTTVEADNVQSANFAAEQSSYLAGVAAAMQAKADGGDTVGFVGGEDTDLIQSFQAGYEQGVKSVDENIKVMVEYAGGFDKTEQGKTLANKIYSAGAKVIFHAAGGTGNGVFNAAKERAKNGEKVWVIGVDSDQYDTGIYEDDKSVTLTSALKRVDLVTQNVAQALQDGNFESGDKMYTIKENGVSLPDENPNLSEEIQKAVNKASEDIKSGKIEVSTKRHTEPGQTW